MEDESVVVLEEKELEEKELEFVTPDALEVAECKELDCCFWETCWRNHADSIRS